MTADKPNQAQTPPAKPGRFRLSMSRTLTLGLTFLVLASLGSTLWITIDAAQQNTFELERNLAELTVEAVIRQVDTHLGAAQKQVEFLGELIERGNVDIGDEQRLSDLMVGTLAAGPQISGIALVRADYSVLRAGRRGEEVITVTGNWADREDIRESLRNADSPQDDTWRTISWIEDFRAPHVALRSRWFATGGSSACCFRSPRSARSPASSASSTRRTAPTDSSSMAAKMSSLMRPFPAGFRASRTTSLCRCVRK